MQANDQLNTFNENKKLPTGLNVLTILTFIGCAFELYSAASNFFNGKKALEEFDKAAEKLAEAPAFFQKMAGPEAREMMEKAIDNKIPMLIISLIAISLCVYGAVEMRKMKRQGYTFWLIGELLPFVSVFIFIGTVYLKTVYVYFAIIPAIFILLYTLQRKHLSS